MLASLKTRVYKQASSTLGSIRWLHRCNALWDDSKSSNIWLERQSRDQYTLRAKAESYRSRAAYKLMEINKKHHLFKPRQTVVDLGFAPGSWSQVAAELVKPGGRVIGVDLLLVEPPEGVSAIQGNFLDPGVQLELETVLANPNRGRYIAPNERSGFDEDGDFLKKRNSSKADVVLSDMCGIWPQETGFWTNSINNSYRMANTSGVVARDHYSSMDLCDAALVFSIKHLRYGGSFVCKFYTGSEDKQLEARLKKVFKTVRRVKPDASRDSSREAYFIGLKKRNVKSIEAVFTE